MNPNDQPEKIVQVSGFGVENVMSTQCNYMLVGVTNLGRVVISRGDDNWADISPKDLNELETR